MIASHLSGWTELSPLTSLPARVQVISGGACEQREALLVCTFLRDLRMGSGVLCDSPSGAFQKQELLAQVGIVPIFVIIKLGRRK